MARVAVVALALGSCQLAVAGISVERVRHVTYGSSRTANRLSASRIEVPVWELGVSHGSPPGDSLDASHDASPHRSTPVPFWALASATRLLSFDLQPSLQVLRTPDLAFATLSVAAVPARGPPAL